MFKRTDMEVKELLAMREQMNAAIIYSVYQSCALSQITYHCALDFIMIFVSR